MKRFVFDPKAWSDLTQSRGAFVLAEDTITDRVHYVQGDIPEFMSTSGVPIGGRRQWREHLKRTGNVELGLSDLKAGTERHNKQRAAEAEALRRAPSQGVREAEAPDGEIRESQRSRMSAEVANRLHGRPTPSIETLLKITLEEARRRY